MVVVPVITMRLLAEEKRSGTLEMLITLPVKDHEVILGKFFGAWGLVLVLILATTLYPIDDVRRLPLEPRAARLGPGHLGLPRPRALQRRGRRRIGLLISALTESQVIAFFVTFVLLFAPALHRLRGRPDQDEAVRDVASFVSFDTRLAPFSRGLLNTRDIVFFAHRHRRLPDGGFPRARAAQVGLRRFAMDRKAKARAETGIYLLLVAAVLVVANVLSLGAYKRIDMTKSERFTLSKGSARLVSEGLKQQLQLDVYVTRGLPKHEAFIQDLTDLMGEYERAAGGKVKYTLIEAKTEEERTAAKDAGLQESAFGDVSETGQDQATITRGFMGIAFKYGSEKEAIPILSPDQGQGLEFWITNKIREIRDKRRQPQPEVRRHHRQGRDQARRVEPRRRAGRPPRAQHARDHRAGAALLQVRGRRPEGRRGGDQQGAARPHHHAARQGLHREGAAQHRPVPDAREIGRLLLGRREHQGLRRLR
jgi:hypothetical protein